MQLTVTELMSEPPLLVQEEVSVREAVRLLLDDSAPQLDVVDSAGQLLGSVPDYELLKAQMAGEGDMPVARVMSGSAVRVDVESTSDFAAAVFRDGRYQRLPVVDQGRVVGQIDRRDVMRLLASVSDDESTAGIDVAASKPVSTIRGPRHTDNRNVRQSIQLDS